MKTLYLFLFILLAGCKTVDYPSHFGKTDLPGSVKVRTEYVYHIQLPPRAQRATYVWKYEGKVLYRATPIRPRTEVIKTEMYFPYPGRYVLEVFVKDPRNQLHVFKSIYWAEEEVSTYGKYIPQWIK